MSNTGASPYHASAEAGNMDLDGLDGGTSPFITLDACDGTLVTHLVSALEEAAAGNNTQIKATNQIYRFQTSDNADFCLIWNFFQCS